MKFDIHVQVYATFGTGRNGIATVRNYILELDLKKIQIFFFSVTNTITLQLNQQAVNQTK